MKLSRVGEFGLIERIRKATHKGRGVRVGIGDDAAWLDCRGRTLLVTTDLLIEGIHFEDFAREQAESLYGKVLRAHMWPFCCIDWAQAAEELQRDYSSVEYDGFTYWYR